MKQILVPTDFSPNAEKALDYAIQLAKFMKSEVFVLHSVDPGLPESTITDANEKMELLKQSIVSKEMIQIKTEICEGATVNAIVDVAADEKTDLVVMGTLGNSAFKEKVFGSKTAAVIGKTDVPVLAIPLLAEWKVPKKILLAINQFDEDDASLDVVFKLAKSFNASIQVAVFTDTDDDYVEDYGEHEAQIITYRDLLKEKHPGIDIHAVHLAGKHFSENLKNWIDKNNIDILVMLTHKRGVLESIFNRSMTKKMSYNTEIPLLAIPV